MLMNKLFFALAITLAATISLAQPVLKNTNSRHGLGFYEPIQNSMHFGLGGTNYSLVDSVYSNTNNFSANSYLNKGQVFFNIDIVGRLSNFQSDSGSFFSPTTYFRGLDFTIPFANVNAVNFGFRPHFSRGYRFEEKDLVDIDSLRFVYLGRGTLNQAFLSYSLEYFQH